MNVFSLENIVRRRELEIKFNQAERRTLQQGEMGTNSQVKGGGTVRFTPQKKPFTL